MVDLEYKLHGSSMLHTMLEVGNLLWRVLHVGHFPPNLGGVDGTTGIR